MEVSALNVSAAAVAKITINQNPYSAEYARPGRGRIEILTKPGSQEYRGEFNTLLRNGHLSSRNAFASAKPQEQRYSVDGFLGGPIGRDGKTMFMLSANDEYDANQAYIHAIGPGGPIEYQLPQTSGEARITGSITRQVSSNNTFSIRPNYQYESEENRDAGGTTLASAATTFSITSSRSPTRSRRFSDRRSCTSSRCCSATSASHHESHSRPRHHRRRRVHRRLRTSRPRPDGNAHQPEREPVVDPRQASRAGGIPTA